ncbi:hypothetical protein ACTXT7_001821 [Hymenolepis weldensis]
MSEANSVWESFSRDEAGSGIVSIKRKLSVGWVLAPLTTLVHGPGVRNDSGEVKIPYTIF